MSIASAAARMGYRKTLLMGNISVSGANFNNASMTRLGFHLSGDKRKSCGAVNGVPNMDYRKKFGVEAGERPRLSKIDASYTGKHESHEKALPEIQAHLERMDKLQNLLYADGSKSL